MKTPASFLYNLILALWVGGIAMFTFIVTPAIFKAYNRDMAGEIVDKLFPDYFMFNIVVSILALIVFVSFLYQRKSIESAVSIGLIVVALVVNLYVNFKLHPEILRIKKEVSSFQTMPPDAGPRKEFRKLHGISMALNLLLMADGAGLLLLSSLLKK
ncbi:MAG: DUF4149 domain-containing protein [Nitrospirae bacterium]|nr:MAG: DUF4149 domain-containing protein [Nitrospirota bacterium]